MAYKHVAVRHLDSPKLSERAAAARNAGWLWWLDAAPVSRPVYDLGQGVRKAYPFVTFRAGTSNRWVAAPGHSTTTSVVIAEEVFVAIDTCPYALAMIGYGAYRGNKGRSDYSVSARGIQNKKYSLSREAYSMRITGNLTSAVKNTLANLLPYTIQEIADEEYEAYCNKSQAVSATKASQLPALLGCVTPGVLLNEVRALKAAGVVFSTPEFRSVAESCDEAAKLANEERNKRVAAILMHFVVRPDGVVAECAGTQNIRNQSQFKLDLSATYPVADVPQALQDKVAVLQTLLPGGHVDGVGMKVDEMLYWVEK